MAFLGIGGDSDAEKSAKRGVAAIQGVRLPNLTPFQLEELVSAGQLTPEQYEAVLQEKSAMEGISTDPALRSAQMDALASLQELGKGGLTLQDKANLARIQSDQLATSRGQQEAIQQQAAARGVGGSGVALMAQMQAAQDAASRRSQSDLDVAGMAQNRALQALQQGGALGGQIRGQEFGEQAQIAQARDQIANFNAQARNQAGMFNVGQRADTARLNLGERQRIADTNVGQRNLSQQMRRDIAQQQFGNQMGRAGALSGAFSNLGQVQAADTAADMGLIGGVLGAGGTLGAAAISKPAKTAAEKAAEAAGVTSDEREKEDVEHFDAGSFLDELVPSKYKYKDDKSNKSEVGVMAQDLERAGAEGAVSEDQEGVKKIDYGKMGGTILASLAGLNERINKLEGGGMMAFPYLTDEDDPLNPDGTPKSLALAPAVPVEMAAPRPLPPPIVDYLTQQKAERDALVEQTNEVNPFALAFGGLSGIGAALQGRDAAGAVTNTLNIAKSGARNKLKQFDEQARLAEAEKDKATKSKFDEFNLSKLESDQALRERENDPDSPESRAMAEIAVARGYKGDPAKLTVSKVREISTSLDKLYQQQRDKRQDERQARLDKEKALQDAAERADRAANRVNQRRERELREEEVSLLRQGKQEEKEQKLVTPFGSANTPKDADDVKNSTVALETLRGSIGRIKELRESEGGETFNTDARVEAKALASAARGQLKEMLKLGVLSATDYSILDSQIPADPLANEYTSPFSSPTKTTLDTTLKNTEAAFRAGLKTRLAKPNEAGRQIIESGAPSGGDTGTVTVIAPNGKTKQIPKSQLQAALDAGGKLVGG